MVSKTSPGRELKQGLHPTKEELIRTVVSMLDEQALDQITSEKVLEISGVSRGSLYHHFEDFAELLELAQVRRFSTYVTHSIAVLSEVFGAVDNREELITRCVVGARDLQAPEYSQVRMERMTAISKVMDNPRMALALGSEQERLTETIADLYQGMQLRGFGNPALQPRTAAVLFQAYALGRTIDDFTPIHMDPENWLYAVTGIIENVFFPAK